MTLGQVLKEGRQRAAKTLRDVERTTGISNGYLSLLESDTIKSPSPKHLHSLAEEYEVSYSLLMELCGYAVPEPASAEVTDALLGEVGDLSPTERSQVRNFVGYLRSTRPLRPESE